MFYFRVTNNYYSYVSDVNDLVVLQETSDSVVPLVEYDSKFLYNLLTVMNVNESNSISMILAIFNVVLLIYDILVVLSG